MVSTLVLSVRRFLSMLARWIRSFDRIKICILRVSSSASSLMMRVDFHFGLAIVLSMMFRRMFHLVEASACNSLYAR